MGLASRLRNIADNMMNFDTNILAGKSRVPLNSELRAHWTQCGRIRSAGNL